MRLPGNSSLPGNAVAQVGSASITKQEFDHWLHIYAAAQGPSGTAGTGPVVVPDPPSFDKCTASLRATTPVPKGSKAPTAAQFKQQYDTLRNEVLGFLITAKWLQDEADTLGVKVTNGGPAVIRGDEEAAVPDSGRPPAVYKTDGRDAAGHPLPGSRRPLQIALQARATRDPAVTSAQTSAHYNAHHAQFALPETRDLKVVTTTSRAQAVAALAALHAGQSWAEVANKCSNDESLKTIGGLLQGVEKGQVDSAVGRVAFSAPTGVIEGPVKAANSGLGYYLVLVTSITPATERTLATASSYIRELLVKQHEQASLHAFVTRYSNVWRGRTKCASGFQSRSTAAEAPRICIRADRIL